MDKQVVFKSALGGFEKKAVLDYIYGLNEENSSVQAQLREQVSSVSQARASLEESLRQANERLLTVQRELEGVKSELSAERSRAMELGGLNEGLQNDVARHRDQIAQVRREMESVAQESEQLRAEYNALKDKKAEVDYATANVGRILLEARSDADKIISDAKAAAQSISSEAETEASRLRRDAQEEASALRAGAEEDAGALTLKTQAECALIKSGAEQEARAIVESASRKADLLRIESKLATEEAAGSFETFIGNISEINGAISKLVSSYNDNMDEVRRVIETSRRAFDKTRAAIESSGKELEPDATLEDSAPDGTAEKTDDEAFFR